MRKSARTLLLVQDVYESWRERLILELEERGWDYREFAKRIGVDPSVAHRIMSGKIECPSDRLKWRIAAVLGLRMDRLWAWPAVVPTALDEWAATA